MRERERGRGGGGAGKWRGGEGHRAPPSTVSVSIGLLQRRLMHKCKRAAETGWRTAAGPASQRPGPTLSSRLLHDRQLRVGRDNRIMSHSIIMLAKSIGNHLTQEICVRMLNPPQRSRISQLKRFPGLLTQHGDASESRAQSRNHAQRTLSLLTEL